MTTETPAHHPTITASGSRYWCVCLCGFTSGSWANITEAHLAFGRHLVRFPPTPTAASK